MARIYLDNNATTRLRPEVLDAMMPYWAGEPGNPSSLHREGSRARRALENSREQIAELLDADPRGIVFTSGGTESNNLAILGYGPGDCGHLILSPIEHPSVIGAARSLESRGWSLSHLPVSPSGVVDAGSLSDVVRPDTQLITLMLANNETGAIQPVEAVVRQASARSIPVHTDAVQAIGRIPVSFRRLGVTSLSVSAHKLHGPAGIGVLVFDPNCRPAPRQFGGEQELSLRPGTESVAAAVGCAKALELALVDREADCSRMAAHRDRFEAEIRRAAPSALIHAAHVERLCNTTSVYIPEQDGQALVVSLDLRGVACSLGSACASGSPEPSHVLRAMGYSIEHARSSLRFSLSRYTTESEIRDAASRLLASVACRQR